MALLIAGLVLFLGVHLVPTSSPLRAKLARMLGEGGYKGAFSLVSLAGFVLIVLGKGRAPFVHVFLPPLWGRHVTMSLMLLSCYCFAAVYLPAALKRKTAHPMLWGTVFWAAGHVFANGDLGSLLLFGSFLGYAGFDMGSANRRGARPQGAETSWGQEALVVLVTALLYGGLLWVHPYAFGVSVLRG